MPLQWPVVRGPVPLDRPLQGCLLPLRKRLHRPWVLDPVHNPAAVHPHALHRPWRLHPLLGAPCDTAPLPPVRRCGGAPIEREPAPAAREGAVLSMGRAAEDRAASPVCMLPYYEYYYGSS